MITVVINCRITWYYSPGYNSPPHCRRAIVFYNACRRRFFSPAFTRDLHYFSIHFIIKKKTGCHAFCQTASFLLHAYIC
ncbi:hypothetical protein DC498_08570 [Terrimonas sp.]|nr:hypothetical protein DC498_08570 [Terrimonas sp.]